MELLLSISRGPEDFRLTALADKTCPLPVETRVQVQLNDPQKSPSAKGNASLDLACFTEARRGEARLPTHLLTYLGRQVGRRLGI